MKCAWLENPHAKAMLTISSSVVFRSSFALTVLGDCSPRQIPDKPVAEVKPITLGEFAEWWLTQIAERERRN